MAVLISTQVYVQGSGYECARHYDIREACEGITGRPR